MAFDNKSSTVVVTGSKVWNDDGNRDGIRPDSITVDLLKTDDSPWTLVAGAVLAGSAALTIAMATLRRRSTETSEKKRSRARS